MNLTNALAQVRISSKVMSEIERNDNVFEYTEPPACPGRVTLAGITYNVDTMLQQWPYMLQT